MRTRMNARAGAIALATTLTISMAGAAWATPAQKCQGGKNEAAGKYIACLGKALKSFVATEDQVRFDAAYAKCDGKLAATWDKLEDAGGVDCPTSGDHVSTQAFIDVCLDSAADAIGGGPLPIDVLTCNEYLTTCNADVGDCQDEVLAAESDLATCEGDLEACESAQLSPLAKTGDTSCFNDAGSSIPCAGTGQDGQTQAGTPISFTDNGNGTITDNVTKLMWAKISDDGSIHDKDAVYSGMTGGIAKAATLNGMAFAGHTDWRLPNRRELFSLSDFGRHSPAINPIFHTGCVPGCTVLTCSCTRNTVYWTSTTYASYYTPASWKVNAQDGSIYAGNRSGESHAARAVRNVN